MGTERNRLNETVLLSTQNTFKLMGKEMNAILGAQTVLIWTKYAVFFVTSIKTGYYTTKPEKVIFNEPEGRGEYIFSWLINPFIHLIEVNNCF